MARKKTSHHSKKHTTKRRRRVGAISGDSKALLMQTVGGIAGAVAGSYLGSVVENAAGTSSYAKYANGGVQLVAGFMLPKLIKQSSPLMKGVQMGLMINGGLTLIKTTGILPGVGGISDYVVPMVGAMQQNYLTDVRSESVPMVGAMGSRHRVHGIANMA